MRKLADRIGKGKILDGLTLRQDSILRNLIAVERASLPMAEGQQLSLFDRELEGIC